MRKVILIGLLAGLGGVLFAQGTQVSEDPLLAEVRALRAEVHQIVSASIRTQLLVARLHLQEQQVLMAGRQLLEVPNALATVCQEMAREIECLEAVNDAQRQWIDFSQRLDAVERSIPAYIKPLR
jgi:hypothetical protein